MFAPMIYKNIFSAFVYTAYVFSLYTSPRNTFLDKKKLYIPSTDSLYSNHPC